MGKRIDTVPMIKTIATKELLLSLVTVVIGFFAFWLWQEAMPLFQSGVLNNATSFAAPAVALMLAGSLFFISSALITHGGLRNAVALLTVMPAFFLAGNWQTVLLGSSPMLVFVPVTGLLALFAVRRMHREHMLSLGFSTPKIAKAGLPIFFTVASIIASWFYFQTIQMADRQKATAVLVPKTVTDIVIRVLAEPLKASTGLPEIRADMTVDELLTAGIRQELKKSGVVLSKTSEQGLTELLAHQRDAFAKQYGITLTGSERVGDVMHRAVIERLELALGPFVQFLPLISALAFFFAFKAFTFPLSLASVAVSALLLYVLRMATIVKSERRQIDVERLTL